MNRESIRLFMRCFKRFIWKAVLVTVLSGIVNFIFAKDLIRFLLRIVDIKVFYLSLPEVFFASVEVALYAGLFFAAPVIFYLIWRDFRPMINVGATKGYVVMFFAVLLFYAGGVFCCSIVLPSGIKFLLSYGSETIRPLISIERFIGFSTAMVFAFSVTFELPMILMVLGRMGVVKYRGLARTRRFAVLFITIASAIITPTPDVYNMSLLAVPAYVLYEVGIFLVKMGERERATAN